MSSEHSNFVQKFAAAFAQLHRVRNETTEDDTDRLIALIDAATAAFDVNDPAAVESLFAIQGISLDVIFKDFIRRRSYIFDNMRVALRAQAQCRATFKSLDEYKHPRPKPSPAKNLSELSVENGNTAAGAIV